MKIFAVFVGLIGYTIWKFYIVRDVKNDIVTREKPANTAEESIMEEPTYQLRSNNNNSEKLHHRKTKNGSAGF